MNIGQWLKPTLGFIAVFSVALSGCGGGSLNANSPGTPGPPAPPPPPQPVQVSGMHAPIRARYLRTNSFYDPNALEFAPPHFSVYDTGNRRFYVTNPYMNEIDVFDAVQETEIAEIPVPGAWGIDLSPDGATLYAGTLIGDVYEVNAQTDQVVRHFAASSIGPNGFGTMEVFVLADGRLAIAGGAGGVDGMQQIGVWNPVTNALDLGAPPSSPLQTQSVCPNIRNVGAFAVSGDRTRVLAASVDESGGGEPVCSYDPATQKATAGVFQPTTFLREIIPSPDGSRFFLTTNLNGVAVFDARTLQLLGQITQPVVGIGQMTLPNAASGAVLSVDGKTLYLVDQMASAIAAYDTTTYALKGWVPSFRIDDLQSGPVIAAIDGTGLIVGPTGHGVDFLDASQWSATPTPVLQLAYVTLTAGPLAGGTVVTSNANGMFDTPPVLRDVYVGNSSAQNASYSNSLLHFTTPPSSLSGTVDLSLVLNDGAVGFAPEGFSYGPAILEVMANAATAEGGQVASIVGYGFGQAPNDVQVSVGGNPAQVVGLQTSAADLPYPVPVETLEFTVPPGAAGSGANVTVTTASGTATATDGFHYLPAVSSYPGSTTLQSGIYDPLRDLNYFVDKDQIQVFSKTTGTWLSPISLPGTTAETQLLAISESPDGTELAVSDYGGRKIYVLDPDAPGSAKAYAMPTNLFGASSLAPTGLAITDGGDVYFATNAGFCKLVASTGVFTAIAQNLSAGEFTRVLLNPDGKRVYSHIENAAFWVDTSNDKIHYSRIASLSGGVHDVAVSADGSTVDDQSLFSDPFLNPEMPTVYIDWETWLPTAIVGEKLNSDGSLLFQPLTDGIDVIARNTGRLFYRVKTAVAPANVYDSLFNTGKSDEIGIITSEGIAFVDLSSLLIPAGDRLPFPASYRTSALSVRAKSTPPMMCGSGCPSAMLRLKPSLRWTGARSTLPSDVGAQKTQ
jgi:sugar lactone lactonase YvrE